MSSSKPCPSCQFPLTAANIDRSTGVIKCPQCGAQYSIKKKTAQQTASSPVQAAPIQQTPQTAPAQQSQYPAQQPAKHNKLNIAVAVIGGLIAFMLLCGIVGGIANKGNKTNTNTNNANEITAVEKTPESKAKHHITVSTVEGNVVDDHANITVKGTLKNDDTIVNWNTRPTFEAVAEDGSVIATASTENDIRVSKDPQDFTVSFSFSSEDLDRFKTIRIVGDLDDVAVETAQDDLDHKSQDAKTTARDTWNRIAEEAAAAEAAKAAASAVSAQPVETQTDILTAYVPNVRGADWINWNEDIAPNYVLELGPADVGEIPAAGTIVYGKLDYLGRTTAAAGNITKALRDAGSANGHDDFGSGEDPSGWPSSNPKVSISAPHGKTYNGYLWNRSHLIADSLGGQAIRVNAITGTRMQNVGANDGASSGGMAYCEWQARDWLDAHPDGTLYYRATPMYLGEERIPRSVVVDMKSSDGAIDKMVLVYNAAKGFDIDYMGGNSNVGASNYQAPEAAPAPAPEPEPAPVVEQPTATAADQMVIITKSGSKYHSRENCTGLNSANSIEWVPLSSLQGTKYTACSKCW